MDLSVTKRAGMALPYGPGFHPWFVRDVDTWLTASAERAWLEGADRLAAGSVAMAERPGMDFSAPRALPDGRPLQGRRMEPAGAHRVAEAGACGRHRGQRRTRHLRALFRERCVGFCLFRAGQPSCWCIQPARRTPTIMD
jgi:hypothetical protein